MLRFEPRVAATGEPEGEELLRRKHITEGELS